MSTVLLPPGHPYLRHAYVEIRRRRDGWQVVWRDLLTVKQDCDFETEAEALSYAEQVRSQLHVVDLELLEDACVTLPEATAMWEGL